MIKSLIQECKGVEMAAVHLTAGNCAAYLFSQGFHVKFDKGSTCTMIFASKKGIDIIAEYKGEEKFVKFTYACEC